MANTNFPHPSAPTIAETIPAAPGVQIDGSNDPACCVCRQSAATAAADTLRCTDCKDAFHGSCVGVNRPTLYVCQACVRQHPRRKRAPGTILGAGNAVFATKKSPGAAGDPAQTSAIPTAAHAPRSAADMLASGAGDMDDDDICPICEDECTCGNARSSGNSADDAVDSAPVPLFAQITSQHRPAAHDPQSAGSYQVISSPSIRTPTKKSAKPTPSSKTRSKRPRKQKGPAEDKSLISRLVTAMGKPQSGAHADDTSEEEELDDSSLHVFASTDNPRLSSSEDEVFVAAASTEQSRIATSAALTQAARMARTKKPTRTPKPAKPATGWQRRKALETSRVRASDIEPAVYEVNSTVIRGREKRASPARRRMASPRLPAADTGADDDDEFINITDVTSDGSVGGAFSETEFDQPGALARSGRHAEWSDSRILSANGDDDDEDIEQEDATYLMHGYSSSSLSDLDEQRMGSIHGGVSDSDLDSGAESDSETSGSERVIGSRRRGQKRHRQIPRSRRRQRRSDSMSGSLLASDSDYESDQELMFRPARTETEHALVEYARSGDDREDELLKLHLEQLHAVRNVMQGCSAPLAEYAAIASESEELSDGDIVFTYRTQSSGDDDEDNNLSDDMMEGWATDARKRWKDADGTGSDSSVSESKIDKLRLREDDEQSQLYSSDAYDEFYTRDAFLDMASDEIDGLNADDYSAELDLDSASLALGVALSMEQQGYSKEDAAAAAAVAAAAYPNAGTGTGSSTEMLDKPAQTTITASMNANGEADPIDGIVSIKSSSNRANSSRMGTGTHTPFAPSDWRVAAAAAAAAAYLDSPKAPTVSYVLPKDLNEARSPQVAIAAAAVASMGPSAESAPADTTSAVTEATATKISVDISRAISPLEFSGATTATAVAKDSGSTSGDASARMGPPRPTRALSMSSSSIFTSQLPNSSFYKPLSSICSPIRTTSAGPATAMPSANMPSAPPGAAPVAGLPLVSLSEVNAALTAFTDSDAALSTPTTAVAERTTPLKRKGSANSQIAGPELHADGGDKRPRRESNTGTAHCLPLDPSALDLSSLLAGSGLAGYDLDGVNAISPGLAMGAGTPMRGGYGARHHDDLASDDDWLLTMDQLVDTDALMIQSPPPSPAEGAGAVADISSQLSLVSGSGRRTSDPAASVTPDPFARWDRIPVNIFRRSRALASSSRRRLAAQDDSLGAMSSLAMTAIKSSRQRRALVNSTLLTQHTLPAEAALQQHAMKLALRGDRRGMRRSESASVLGLHGPPPAPPPTPLSARALLHQARTASAMNSPTTISPKRVSRGSQGASRRRTRALEFSPTRAGAEDRSVRHRRLVKSGIVTDVGTPYESQSQASDSSETATAAANGRQTNSIAPEDADGNGSDTGYAFGWVEDEEDLALFAMPSIDESEDQQPSLTMLLAANSPMLMPYRSESDVGSERPL